MLSVSASGALLCIEFVVIVGVAHYLRLFGSKKDMGWEGNMALMETEGPEWRKHRRSAQRHIHLDTSATNENVQHFRICSAFQAIFSSPEDFLDHIKTPD
ncbi:hypothetical protein D9619_002189 [Psilocybe cf. subviscida]|uniref:Uncharacterized protein n=1 Tax=Psilocybe cf. subviscida TaxID=2480587 RepID=A0A8H5BEE5_9AGAR|nr:hypothetical protein D9619_002189 [Psilocybe cf. subviscida]